MDIMCWIVVCHRPNSGGNRGPEVVGVFPISYDPLSVHWFTRELTGWPSSGLHTVGQAWTKCPEGGE